MLTGISLKYGDRFVPPSSASELRGGMLTESVATIEQKQEVR